MKKIIVIVFALIFSLMPFIDINAYGFGFKKNNNHQIPEIGFYDAILKENNAYYVGNKEKIYLTFDVGYDNGHLTKYLDILKEENVQASFFVTGDFVKRFSPILKRIYDDHHLICNHSYAHKAINLMSEAEIRNDLEKLEMSYFDEIGQKMVKIFRPPEGQFDEKSLKILCKLGYKTIFWSIAHVDWKASNDDALSSVINNLHDGAIILLHTVNTNNYENLRAIINHVRGLGYQFATVDEI